MSGHSLFLVKNEKKDESICYHSKQIRCVLPLRSGDYSRSYSNTSCVILCTFGITAFFSNKYNGNCFF